MREKRDKSYFVISMYWSEFVLYTLQNFRVISRRHFEAPVDTLRGEGRGGLGVAVFFSSGILAKKIVDWGIEMDFHILQCSLLVLSVKLW